MENLQNGTKMKRLINGSICYFDGSNIRDERGFSISNYLDDIDFAKAKYEILSEEIDIDSIEELYTNDIKSVGESETKCWTGRNLDIAFANKINELIKAIKQLNKKIGE